MNLIDRARNFPSESAEPRHRMVFFKTVGALVTTMTTLQGFSEAAVPLLTQEEPNFLRAGIKLGIGASVMTVSYFYYRYNSRLAAQEGTSKSTAFQSTNTESQAVPVLEERTSERGTDRFSQGYSVRGIFSRRRK